MQIRNKSFLSPFFIFIKDEGRLSDEELLQLLDLKNYSLVTEEAEREREKVDKRYLFIAEDSQWKHLMDDFCYTLWHNESIPERLQSLSKDYDIYCCSIGDVDDSFDFQYFKSGQLVRDFVVEDLNYTGGVIMQNEGEPIPGEKAALEHVDRFEKVLGIARLIGIQVEHQLDQVRCYGTSEFRKLEL